MDSSDWRLPEALARNMAARGFDGLTPVQAAVRNTRGTRADLLISAPTGSGKTVAFGLALAKVLLPAAPAPAPRALVVTPTRELAAQVADELRWLYAGTGLRVGSCTGGTSLAAERDALAAGIDVAIGTLGRLRDHLARGSLAPAGVGCVVVDEADHLTDPAFRADLEGLLLALPQERQLMMLSATLNATVEGLARRYLREAVRVEASAGPREVAFQAVAVAAGDRERAVVNLLRLHEARGAVVFCGRRSAAGELGARLRARGFRVATLSGALSQPERSAAIAAMRAGSARVLVATDLAARGIDLPELDLVIHADLPADPATLIHRSGRTGRAGRGGLVVLVVPWAQRRRALALAARAQLALDWQQAPGREAVAARDLERMIGDPALAREADARERAAAQELLAVHAPERVAAAFGRLWRRARPEPEDLGDPAPREPRSRWRDGDAQATCPGRG